MVRTYSELIKLPTFEERFEYLKLNGQIGDVTFGYKRYLNQVFYKSPEWRRARAKVIARDLGRDLGVEGHEIYGTIYVHHMNPITIQDIQGDRSKLTNPEFLISVSYDTHKAITLGDSDLLRSHDLVIRTPNDECPWRT